MGRFVNPNNSAFQVALNSQIYVDKTGMIAYINRVLGTMEGYICNSRPRRFGKSITANMLTAYYSKGCDSESMFTGLEISKSADFKKHLNKYDVIHIDVQWFLTTAVTRLMLQRTLQAACWLNSEKSIQPFFQRMLQHCRMPFHR